MVTETASNVFLSGIKGKIIQSFNPEYDDARKVFNGIIDKYPAYIIKCADQQDVALAVDFAKQQQLLVAVRGGGHNAAGFGVCDEGLVIDLSAMNKVVVDPVNRTVRVGGGCTLADVDRATQPFGLVVPSGVFSSTGVGGLTLGGGLGHLTRKHGLSIDNLLEAEVVLADGRCVQASAQSNPDLFWALRGGGGNFGIVTNFLFQAHELSTVFGGPMFWFMEDSPEILRWYRKFIITAPETVSGFFATLGIPPSDHFPTELHLRKMCAIVWCCSGTEAEAAQYFNEARKLKAPVIDLAGPMPFVQLQTLFDPIVAPGTDMYWKADMVNELSDEAISRHLEFGLQLPTWQSGMHIYPINGAASKINSKDTAWNHRQTPLTMIINGISSDPALVEKSFQWAKDYWNTMHPYSAGSAYINFMMDEGTDRVKSSYGENYARLREIKTKYDPHNYFRVNQNIPPL
jgi:FAD binding domain/Berberine and berberine like